MAPVRIKYFGLISMTRFAYLVTLAAVCAIALLVLLVAAILGVLPPIDTMWSSEHHVPQPGAQAWLYNYFYWFILVCLVAEAIDVYCSMRLFAKKDKEQRALIDELSQQIRAEG